MKKSDIAVIVQIAKSLKPDTYRLFQNCSVGPKAVQNILNKLKHNKQIPADVFVYGDKRSFGIGKSRSGYSKMVRI